MARHGKTVLWGPTDDPTGDCAALGLDADDVEPRTRGFGGYIHTKATPVVPSDVAALFSRIVPRRRPGRPKGKPMQ